MGVPKFYRWISERYPCLSQIVKDYQIPEFDSFYLDMNGIIHTCSHPNDSDPMFRISEDKIFQDIFNYLEALFRIVKPKKVLFMAIDGVAPRAKMNQQRGRRFRSAREAEDLMRKAVANGVVLPGEARFDSNCITPGTGFMARLNEHLKYFVNQKLSSDRSWQKVEVIFSGHEVPGEGEHKIMDYIRYQRSQPNYNPFTRHCLYGLDADLIMLGLVTHEPLFSLLREEVVFGKSSKKSANAETTTFHLLHLAVLREYLDHEFRSLKTSLPFPYDIERIIDDWVLMGYLVGNDFVPHLPDFHISQEILPFLYKTYKDVLPKLGGYININGTLDLPRFQQYLSAVSEFDLDNFADKIGGQRWFRGKKEPVMHKGQSKDSSSGLSSSTSECDIDTDLSSTVSSKVDSVNTDSVNTDSVGVASEDGGGAGESLFLFGGLDDTDINEEEESIEKLKRDLDIKSDMKTYFAEEDSSFRSNFDKEMHEMKCHYYQDKFDIMKVDKKAVGEICKCYIVGLQWVLSYYYTGVPSWSWFYPYHYAPYVSDIANIESMVIEFHKSTPLLPFQQLLAVLPPASKFLLPSSYQSLMVGDNSPVKDFYPLYFETDLNGKQHEWEAVVLIPFIDETRLLEAIEPLNSSLTPEEVKRNAHGPCLVYTYDHKTKAFLYSSPHPTRFPNIVHCKAKCDVLSSDPYAISKESLVQGLSQSLKSDAHYPGFPTLKHIPHTSFLEAKGVRVFQAASRGQNMCLRIQRRPTDEEKSLDILAHEYIGRKCFAGWPYLNEAKICGMADTVNSFYDDSYWTRRGVKIAKKDMSPEDVTMWKNSASDIKKRFLMKQGIEIGEVKVLVYVQELQGKKYQVDTKGRMCLHKQWSMSLTTHPLQTLVFDKITDYSAKQQQEEVKSLKDFYCPGSTCFLLNTQYYGEQCEVVSASSSQQKVTVKFSIQSEPDLSAALAKYEDLRETYIPQFVVARDLGLPNQILGRITSSLRCEKGSPDNKKERSRFELGLNLKHGSKNMELVGYVQKRDRFWSLSDATVDIIKNYMERFPTMFKYFIDNPSCDKYYESHLFPPESGSLEDVKEWLKTLPTYDKDLTKCGSDTLNERHIMEIDSALKSHKEGNSKSIEIPVTPSQLYMPNDRQGNVVPDSDAEYYVLDRVVNVSPNGTVPFGYRGTIIGIIYDESSNPDTIYEVLFDNEFLGGLTVRCSGRRVYRLPPFCLINLTYGKRLRERNKGSYHHKNRTGHRSTETNEPASHQYKHQHSGRHHESRRSDDNRQTQQPPQILMKRPNVKSSQTKNPDQSRNEFDQMLQSVSSKTTPKTTSTDTVTTTTNGPLEALHNTPKSDTTAPVDILKAVQALSKVSISSTKDDDGQQKENVTGSKSHDDEGTQSSTGAAPPVTSSPFSLTVQALFNSANSQPSSSKPGIMGQVPQHGGIMENMIRGPKPPTGRSTSVPNDTRQPPLLQDVPPFPSMLIRGPTPPQRFPSYPQTSQYHFPPPLPMYYPQYRQPFTPHMPFSPRDVPNPSLHQQHLIRGPKPPQQQQQPVPNKQPLLNPTAPIFTPLQVERRQAKPKQSEDDGH